MTTSPHSDDHPLNDEAWARVQNWVLGHGESSERQSFEEHLTHCAVCRLEADRAADQLSTLSLLSNPGDRPGEAESNSGDSKGEALWGRLEARLGLQPELDPRSASVQSWRSWQPNEGEAPRVLPADDEGFQPIGVPGITVRKLHVSQDRSEVTMLVRMAAGASFPPHRHGGLERCLVLSGELHVGSELARAGDYVGAEPGTLHPEQWTETGCELFITSSTSDELIDS
ncbi:MAG: cupin domain-containing protein [Planctomycetota bacterium]